MKNGVPEPKSSCRRHRPGCFAFGACALQGVIAIARELVKSGLNFNVLNQQSPSGLQAGLSGL